MQTDHGVAWWNICSSNFSGSHDVKKIYLKDSVAVGVQLGGRGMLNALAWFDPQLLPNKRRYVTLIH
jgi:hypothetical protein